MRRVTGPTAHSQSVTSSVENVRVGGSTRTELRERLRSHAVLLNAHAETLLDHPVFELRDAEVIGIVVVRVAELHLETGGTLSEVFAAAFDSGLELCPPDTGPYFRLSFTSQTNAPDSVLSAGRSPAGSVKVAAAPLDEDVEFPKGFYLRVVDHRCWLRGFRCDDEYRFSPDDQFAFRIAEH